MAFREDEQVINKWISKKGNAHSRGIEFSLTFQSMKNLLSSKKCYYTGVPISSVANPQKGIHKLSIDRIDSTKGYVAGNVVACSEEVNNIKSAIERHPELFKKIYDKLQKKRGK